MTPDRKTQTREIFLRTVLRDEGVSEQLALEAFELVWKEAQRDARNGILVRADW